MDLNDSRHVMMQRSTKNGAEPQADGSFYRPRQDVPLSDLVPQESTCVSATSWQDSVLNGSGATTVNSSAAVTLVCQNDDEASA